MTVSRKRFLPCRNNNNALVENGPKYDCLKSSFGTMIPRLNETNILLVVAYLEKTKTNYHYLNYLKQNKYIARKSFEKTNN